MIGRPRLPGELEEEELGVEWEGPDTATLDIVIMDCDWAVDSDLTIGASLPPEPDVLSGTREGIDFEGSGEVTFVEGGAILMTSSLDDWARGIPTLLVNLRRFGGLPRRATGRVCSGGGQVTVVLSGFKEVTDISS